jgi:hypothetical protein
VVIANAGISAAAWSTNGIGFVQSAATFTDSSTANGSTIPIVYMNLFDTLKYSASNTVTITVLYGTYFKSPVIGTNVTATSTYSLGADSAQFTFLYAPRDSSISYSTSNVIASFAIGATLSGQTKTVNIGTGGLTGSNTNISIGSSFGTITTINGTTLFTGTVNSTSYSIGTSFVANTTQVTISGIPLSANGSTGSSGQVLASNGATGAPYWTTVAGVNTSAQYSFSNTITFTGGVVINSVLQPGVVTINAASVSSITPVAGNTNHNNIYNINATPTINQPSGAPYADAQKLMLRLKDSGTANTLTWNVSVGSSSSTTAGFRPMATSNVALPSTTIAGKVTYVACVYNALDSYWDVVGVSNQ